MKNKILNEKTINYFILFLISLITYHVVYGIETLNPTNINWLMSVYHDWGQHYLGWAYFREESWNYPIGDIQNYNYPAGTNIGLTDSIPILAIFFKFFKFLLPEDFQYFGIWLLLCFFLNGLFSFKILKLYFKDSKVILFLCTIFLIVNPILIYRGMHPALCGHWLIIASMYNYLLNSNSINVEKINKNQIIILLLSAGINPYLFLMVVGFNFIIPFKHFYYDKTVSLRKALITPLVSIIAVLLIWVVIGMITFNNDKGLEVVDSYGLYGFNLNNFYNPSGYSKFLPQLDWTNHHQYEGFAYLGIGVIILIVITLVFLVRKKELKLLKNKFIPLILLVIISFIFAITNKISLDSKVIFEYQTLGIIKKIGNIFRASGRFIWIFYYSIFLATFVIFIRSKISTNLKTVILSLLLIIQIYDISHLISYRNLPKGKYELSKFDKEWFDIASKFKKIVTYPPFQYDLLTPMDYQDLCYIALKSNIPITCGYVARESGSDNVYFANKLNKELAEGRIYNDYLYITTAKNIEDFYPAIYKNELEIKFLNGYYLIFNKNDSKTFSKNLIEIKKGDSIKNVISRKLKIQKINKPIYVENQIKYFVEQLNDAENLQIKGWAFLNKTKNNLNDSIYIILSNVNHSYISKARLEVRTDITQAYGGENLDNSGFKTTIFKNSIEEGVYDLGIGIKDKNDNVFFEKFSPSIQIKVKTSNKIEVINRLPELEFKSKGNIDLVEFNGNNVKVRGWSIIPKNKFNYKIKVIFASIKNNYLVDTDFQERKDITQSYNDGYNYDNSGFVLDVNKNEIAKGNYRILIMIEGKESSLFDSEKILNIN
ncbi:DUF6311 domain-containing protein [Flavobacterium sp.]|uniref:DUF6311 domain-containing protein n=1 Tax=Flavobacterium sp. TaxID=239 RepID=UPI0040470FFA